MYVSAAPSTPETWRRPPYRRSTLLAGVMAIAGLLFAIYAFSSWVGPDTPEGGLQFVIPEGAADTLDLPTIDTAIAIPTSIVFPAGEPAVLSIRNDDLVANRAGPWVIGAGQTYTISFDEPGVYEYVCSVKAEESVTITVE
jgi:hypothetical protein